MRFNRRPFGGPSQYSGHYYHSPTTPLILLTSLYFSTLVKSNCHWPSGGLVYSLGECGGGGGGGGSSICCQPGDLCLANKLCARDLLEKDEPNPGGTDQHEEKESRYAFYRGGCWLDQGRNWNTTACGAFCLASETHPVGIENVHPVWNYVKGGYGPGDEVEVAEVQNWWYCEGQPPSSRDGWDGGGNLKDPAGFEGGFSLVGEWKVTASAGFFAATGTGVGQTLTPVPEMYETRTFSSSQGGGAPTTRISSGVGTPQETGSGPGPTTTPTDSPATTPPDSPATANNADGNGMSNSTVIAIAVGSSVGTIVVVALLVLAILLVLKKRKRERMAAEAANINDNNKNDTTTPVAYNKNNMATPYISPSIGSPGTLVSELPSPELGLGTSGIGPDGKGGSSQMQWGRLHGDSAPKFELQSAEKYELQGTEEKRRHELQG